jgi:hypothetical protein
VAIHPEDPTTVEWFTSEEFRANFSGWEVQYTVVDRLQDGDIMTVEYARQIGPVNEMLNSLVRINIVTGSRGLCAHVVGLHNCNEDPIIGCSIGTQYPILHAKCILLVAVVPANG